MPSLKDGAPNQQGFVAFMQSLGLHTLDVEREEDRGRDVDLSGGTVFNS